MRIIFCGTPEFASVHLQGLIEANIVPIAVFTQPDRPSGRGQKLTACPTKTVALAHGIPVYQPNNLKNDEVIELIKNLQCDLMIVVAYGLIIPKRILSIPILGCINVHASLLPRWRGAAPIQRAIEAGDKETGVTIMQMDEGLDTGNMLAIYPCAITNQDTGQTLTDKLILLGIKGLKEVLSQLKNNTIQSLPQPIEGVTYAHKITKEETMINWTQTATQIDRQIRAWQPHLVAKTLHHGNILKIYQAEVIESDTQVQPGTIIKAQDGIEVACGKGKLNIKVLQIAGGKALQSHEFLRGHSLQLGEILGQ
ncbi:methionyl-tRNA formyltransferase [Ferrovum sp. PN-J185]|uniref:methionyl-tRNA formyltransferase n=1 Tax=Ferrovum sp. PN-J185 TaxID=1356306 RepID=UPI00079C665B|nr:methionyl-tRNA formyltransferase [Ferrovum sp. PN-J185]KXW55928.1 methionyl-tRNA formyltransferase [Ferrovum sp. PN-J185]MCC6068683.1 methionyl-tRNA formyltransferase [Ferrovum sp. PN-J185]MDE1891913.1 methionyl-tRNA formyltransferase [Betaproteobacteria bacterium]MDE2057006.1 methionyl-tRNA formyltransferase [Betaproteobacteria bacterium]